MDEKIKRKFEIGLGMRGIAFLFSISSANEVIGEKWILNSFIENVIQNPSVFVILLVTCFTREGIRVSSILSIFSELLLQFLKIDNSLPIASSYTGDLQTNKVLHIASAILIALEIWASYAFPLFSSLPLTGSYKVGYTTKLLNNQRFAVFYPTDQPYVSKLDTLYLPQLNKYLKTTALITSVTPSEFKTPHIPETLLKLSIGPALKNQRMGVRVNATLAKFTNSIPVMIYSHGLGSHMNLQASLCKDLASKGVIVLSPQHPDEDYLIDLLTAPPSNTITPLQRFLQTMEVSLESRKTFVKQLADFATNDISEFRKIFPESSGADITIRDKIIVCGHSYGGQTALLASLEHAKIYTTIILDPVMSVFNENETYRKALLAPQAKPFLFLCSENFHSRYPFFSQREHISAFLDAQKKIKNAIIAGQMNDFGHCSFIDIAKFIPKELAILREDVRNVSNVSSHLMMLNKLVEYFIYHAQSTSTELSTVSTAEVLKKFDAIVQSVFQPLPNPLYLFHSN